ncbi:hypothetical protein [Brevibacillus borstelensis]|uniref:hypothetical protein n=1 Tax=Brevibacillus borstelensis TaxID=45462 RepID=UPI0030BEEF01
MSVLLAILGIGLLLLVIVVAVVFALLKKGAGFLFKGGHRGYRRYSSSDCRHRGLFGRGHKSYGHSYYRRKHSSRRGFFSS